MTVRTRFAPSPTGYLHIGGARTALFSWAYARKHGGTFILRIEDTDLERSTPEAVQAILDGMKWLGLDYDEGPFYQMQRMERYKEVHRSRCWPQARPITATPRPEELDAMREAQRARGEKPRYDGTWRPEPGKTLPPIRRRREAGGAFQESAEGVVAWDDLVKGHIEFSNNELDDLVIARADGTPTYNFCVVVDDWDMGITHVIRGDDHVNNTPRQINILKALGATLPQYAHLPMILGDDGEQAVQAPRRGERDAIRRGRLSAGSAASTIWRAWAGRTATTRFSRSSSSVEWFDLDHISTVGRAVQHRKAELAEPPLPQAGRQCTHWPTWCVRVSKRAASRSAQRPTLCRHCRLIEGTREPRLTNWPTQRKCSTSTCTRMQRCSMQQLSAEAIPALRDLSQRFATVAWETPAISAAIKEVIGKHGLKMPQARDAAARDAHRTNADTVGRCCWSTLFARETVLARMDKDTCRKKPADLLYKVGVPSL